MTKQIHFIALCFILGITNCFSQTKMPSFFSNKMVLQQLQNVPIWGTDTPGNTIEILTSWGSKTSAITDANGKWRTTILTNKASFENQEITVQGSTTIILKNVLIGEVWFCSGQSNMEMPMKGLNKSLINNSEALVNASKNEYIHLFKSKRAASLSLEEDVIGAWDEATPESVQNFSAIGYLFGKKLFDQLQIPIGIMVSSWGGTPIECWLPKTSIQQYPNIKVPDTLSKVQDKQKRPTALYNGMVYPFKDYSIKGFLWYQGEANRKNAIIYKNFMQTLIGTWREQWHGSSLPFYFVQIAPYNYNARYKSPKEAFGADLVREAQSFAAQEIPNTGVVITSDVGKCSDIHPPEKNIIATRLANFALAEQYNLKDIAYRSPEYSSMKVKKSKAILSFNFYGTNKDNGILDGKRELKNFVIAGEDKIFYPAQVKIKKNKTIEVYSDKVKNPVAVRYGFEDCLEGSLFSNAGLPVSPFRTDDWLE